MKSVKGIRIGLFCFFLAAVAFSSVKIPTESLIPVKKILPTENDDFYFKRFPAIVVDKNGFIYTTEQAVNAIFKISPEGKLVARIGKKGVGPGDLLEPLHLAILENRLIVTDKVAISFFDTDGKYLGKFRKFDSLYSIAVNRNAVFCLFPMADQLVKAYGMDGKKVNGFGFRYPVDYSIHKFSDRGEVDLNLYNGTLLSGDGFLYCILHSVGEIFAYDLSGKLVGRAAVSLDPGTTNRIADTFFKKGLSDFRKDMDPRKVPQESPDGKSDVVLRYIDAAAYCDGKLFLKKESGVTGNRIAEMIQVDAATLRVEKILTFSNSYTRGAPFRHGKFFIRRDGGFFVFYIMGYDVRSGEIYIDIYKKEAR